MLNSSLKFKLQKFVVLPLAITAAMSGPETAEAISPGVMTKCAMFLTDGTKVYIQFGGYSNAVCVQKANKCAAAFHWNVSVIWYWDNPRLLEVPFQSCNA